MEIRLVRNAYHVNQDRCATCGNHLEPDTLLRFAYDRAGAEIGQLCEDCSTAGLDGLRDRMRQQAARLRARASQLDRLAGEEVHVGEERELEPFYSYVTKPAFY